MTKADLALRRSLVRAEREQHSTVLIERVSDVPGAFVARSQPMVEFLERRGTLTRRQARAGAHVYECWAVGLVGARDPDAWGGGTADAGGYSDKRLAAATDYRKMRQAVGLRLWPVVFACCVEDWSCSRFANERGGGMHKQGAVELLRLALDTIADHLGYD